MRILFDANVLINGVLLPQSQSRKVIEKLNHDTFKGFVCQNTLDEIQGAFIRAYRNTGVDLTHIFMSTIRFLPIIFYLVYPLKIENAIQVFVVLETKHSLRSQKH